MHTRLEFGRTPACPHWCTGQHPKNWETHVLNCGEMKIGDVTYTVDAVKYREDEPELISFCTYAGGDSWVSNYTASEARQVYEMLGRALGLVGFPPPSN